jgi:hypothetical protein
VRARVTDSERASLVSWLTPSELALFDSMQVGDRRHGLDVVAALRGHGVSDRDVLVAGLVHDAGKGATGVVPRVVWSLGQAWGPWVWHAAAMLPGMRRSLAVLRDHADESARLADAAGCPPRTVALIRNQEQPRDPEFGELLRLADEAS